MLKKEVDEIKSFISKCPECNKSGKVEYIHKHSYRRDMSIRFKCRDNMCGNRYHVTIEKF